MSAWMCSNNHINAIVRAAQEWAGHVHYVDKEAADWQELAKILAAENRKSVNYRYDEKKRVPKIVYREDTPLLSAMTILKACASYDYQSCETPDYYTSRAYRIIQEIRRQAIPNLPEWDRADGWSIE